MRGPILFFLLAAWGFAQAPAPSPAKDAPDSAKADPARVEERELNRALGEAGSSPIEFIRVLERHLAKYPNSPRKAEIERALVKAAIDTKDNKRIVLYGEPVLAREPDDIQVLDRVTRALLSSDAKDTSERARKYARHYQELLTKLRTESPPGHFSKGEWAEEMDKGMGRALVLEARATGNLGNTDEAIALATKAYASFPTAESAREIARWLVRAGRDQEAVRHFADAFTIADPRNTDADRAKDRARMGELYRNGNGSEKGLGDLVLEAYDRTSALLAERKLRLQASDPNAQVTNILDFTLSSLDGQKLQLAALKGKAIIFDFWATWCGPCRVQHPLYEEVKKRFQDAGDVVFLSVDTDEERELVPPFVKQYKWQGPIYYDDGLARMLQIGSIPTTVVVDKRGEVVSRLNGFVPERFVDMLSERIREARK